MTSFLIALQFLSRIQLAKQTVWTEEDFGRSLCWFPIVGTIIGALLYGLWLLLSHVFTGVTLSVLIVAFWYGLTGGLHADGFMDTADGLFSGRSRERMLEIMKDSRVGSNGVMAFFFLALLKIGFTATMEESAYMLCLVAIPTAARYGTLISVLEFPYARQNGMGKAFATYARPYTLVWGFLAALVPLLCIHEVYFILLGAAMATALVANTYITKCLGGVTGDTYGAVTELTELVLLGICAALSSIYIPF